MKYIIYALSIISLSCAGSDCKYGSFRCDNNIIEVCTKENWEEVIDCNEYYQDMECVDITDNDYDISCKEVLK